MHPQRPTLIAFVGLAFAACDPATSPADSAVEGRWASAREALNPNGSYQTFLTFDGAAYASEVRNYGLYAGQQPNDLSAYSRTEGTFLVDGDSLQFVATHLVTWDGFFGPNPPERVAINPQGGQSSRAHFSIDRNRLTLRYFSYPADAPVATSRSYWRLPHVLQN
jgi:hypothetical protein